MIRSLNELVDNFNNIVGDNTDDSVLTFMEDITDTLNNYDALTHDNEDWHAKYNELDTEWRNKYKERFMNHEDVEYEIVNDEDVKPSPKTFEELFN